ncbi:hypothetical protein S40288_03117 [Stachybotrys chartarum IBT 40288]|nr:hypothetical protein S40288_03117 [Stachybotrys chartarum IBT 40288]
MSTTAARHSRTRSGRVQVAANSAKQLSHAQPNGTSINAAGNSISGSILAATAPSTSPSSLSVFLTSLKLLDLDLLPDWPGISHQTFVTTAAGAALGHKKRVQCVEWALFQLFALWDPDETKNKLKPFFPPLDQVQSINLRAALLRALENAKKNGVLGRDAIIRKTMLDECKGERLEEVLAAFSIAVLKKVVADDLAASGLHHALAVSLAFENRGYQGERTELQVLNLAHRVKLRKLIERRSAAQRRYRDFSDLLGVKERGVARRSEEIRLKQQSSTAGLSPDTLAKTRRTVRNNWAGDEHWMETLLYGSAAADRDRLMGMPFDRVWRRVQQGRLADLEGSSGGLLEQLDARVKVQNERLEKWKRFRTDLSSGRTIPSPTKARTAARETRGIDFGFGAHEKLRVGRLSHENVTCGAKMNDEYAGIIKGLRDGLDNLNKKDADPTDFLKQFASTRHASADRDHLSASNSEPGDDGAVSELSELEDDEAEMFPLKQPYKSPSPKLQNPRRLPARPKLSYSNDSPAASPNSAPFLRRRSTLADEDYDIGLHDIDSPVVSPTRNTKAPKPTLSQSPTRVCQDVPEELEVPDSPSSPTQELADQILQSMNNASPSPTKQAKPRRALSLAERTRLSMVRGSSMFLEDEEPELPLSTQTPVSEEGETTRLVVEETEDLASRTRRSMAGFEKAKQKAQMERRRSQRRSKVPPRREGSYFPRVDEDPQEQTMLTEELMAEEDMEAVFRSRPKIKASPLPSPTREWEDDC